MLTSQHLGAEALRAYADICERLGYEAEYVASIRELAGDFYNYRMAQGDGDPEAPPHRRDVPEVLAAMRGQPSTINVMRDKLNVPKGIEVSFQQCEQCWQPATCKKYGCRDLSPASPLSSTDRKTP